MPDDNDTRATPRPDLPEALSAAPGTGSAPLDGTLNQTPQQAAQSAEVSGSAFPAIPGYEIRSKLGEGGMGVVYLAKQVGLNRDVAIKTLLGATVSRATLARFWAEAEVMAAVKHPNVVQVIELGEYAGKPFMVMEFVSGGSLANRLRGGVQLPARDAAGLMEKVARGVAAAHDLGIVHRDLKPDNVLMDGDTPRVADFGIAKRKAHEMTQTNAMMGTPAYMAPEQAASQARHVGPAADVWSLGVMLYECLSGKRPFDGESVFDVLAKIATENPPALRTLVNGLPRDLQTVVAKCLTKEPELRYASAKELADDLERFARGEPIAARPVGVAERFARWVRRKPTAAAAYGFSSLAVLLALVVFVVFGFWRAAEDAKQQLETANDQLTTEKKQTEEARDEAVGLRLRAEGLFKVADEARGEALTQKGNADKLRDDAIQQKLAAHKARTEAERLEGIAKKAQEAEADARKTVEREREKLAMFEYGRTMQVAHQEWRDGNIVGAISLLEKANTKHRGWEWYYINRLCNGSLLTLKGHTESVGSASFSGDGSRVVTGSSDHTAKVWDAKTGTELLTFKGHTGSVASASFSGDGSRVVTGSSDHTVKVWDAKTGGEVLTLEKDTGVVLFVCFSADGSRIITGSDKTAKVWDAKTGAELLALKGHTDTVLYVSFSGDGSRIVTGSSDNTAKVWDAKTGTELLTLKHPERVTSVSFSGDGSRVVTGSWDKTAKVWDAKTGTELLTLKGHTDIVLSVSLSRDGTRIVTSSSDKTAKVWDAKTGVEVLTLAEIKLPDSIVSSDGSRVITIEFDNTAQVCDASTRAKLHALKGHSNMVTSASFSGDGLRIVTGSWDKTAKVWDAKTGTELLTLKGHTSSVYTAAFSADGTRVVTSSADSTAKVWDSKTGAELFTIRGHTDRVNSASFSGDDSRIITGSSDKTAKVWDAKTGAELLTLKGHTNWVISAIFSSDGSQIVTVGLENVTKVWDAGLGAKIRPPARRREP